MLACVCEDLYMVILCFTCQASAADGGGNVPG